MHKSRSNRRANVTRRKKAEIAQTTFLGQDGKRYPATPELIAYRTAENAAAYRKRYPTAPTYKQINVQPKKSGKYRPLISFDDFLTMVLGRNT